MALLSEASGSAREEIGTFRSRRRIMSFVETCRKVLGGGDGIVQKSTRSNEKWYRIQTGCYPCFPVSKLPFCRKRER